MADDGLNELAARTAAGDREALGELYEALRPLMAPTLRRYRRLGAEGPLEPADLAQQAFLIVAELARSWPRQGPFGAWFRRLFPLEILNYRRGLLRWDGPAVESLPHDELARRLETRAGPATEPDPSDVACCRQLLGLLPPPYRLLLHWRFADGLTYRDIERLHGLPAASAQARCERALAYLRAAARGESPPPLAAVRERTDRRGCDVAVATARLWSAAEPDGLLPPAAAAAAAVGLGPRAYETLVARLRAAGCLGRAAGVAFDSRRGRRWRPAVDLAEALRRLAAVE